MRRTQVSSEDLLKVLRANLDLTIAEEAMLVQDILNLSRARAYKIVREEHAWNGMKEWGAKVLPPHLLN